MSSPRDMLRRVRLALRRRGVLDQDIDDIVHDAYVRLEQYRATATVHEPEAFLVRAAANLAIDAGRRRMRSPIVAGEPDLDIEDDAPRPDQVWLSTKRIDLLNQAFAALDPLTRQMLSAQRLDGMRVDDIARMHGVTKSAVEKRLAKGMMFLSEWVRES